MSKLTFLAIIALAFTQMPGNAYEYINEHRTSFSIELYHALDANDPAEYLFRGKISLSLTIIENANIEVAQGRTLIDENKLTYEEQQQLKKLAQQGDYYKMKAVITYADGTQRIHYSAANACLLWKSGLQNVLLLSVDNQGTVAALSETIATGNVETCQENAESHISSTGTERFKTKILVEPREIAPEPDTVTFLEQINRERETRAKEDSKPKSYWIYLVPMLIFWVLVSAMSPKTANTRQAAESDEEEIENISNEEQEQSKGSEEKKLSIR